MAFALVSSVGAGLGPSGGTTSAINTIGATLFVANLEWYTPTHGTDVDPIDSQSNSWVPLTTRSGNNIATKMYYVANPTTSATHTFSSNNDNDSYCGIEILAFSGALLSGVLDAQSGAASAGAVTTHQPGSITPAGANSLFVACAAVGDGGGTVSINAGFTIVAQHAYAGGVYVGGAAAYLIQAGGPTGVNPTWSLSATGINAAMAVFKPDVVATKAPPALRRPMRIWRRPA